jgi:hypothetical protein
MASASQAKATESSSLPIHVPAAPAESKVRARPNYFIALKMADSKSLVNAIGAIQRDMVERVSNVWIENSLTWAGRAHFTFFVLAVDDSVLRSGQDVKLTQRVGGNLIDLDTAICSFLNTRRPVMDYLRDYLAQASSSSLPRLGFGRLDSFGTKVLFVKPSPEDQPAFQILCRLQQIVYDSFVASVNAPVPSDSLQADGRSFQAHVTIAKTSKVDRRFSAKLLPEYYEGFDRHLESVNCDMLTIDLLSMLESDEMGYYKSYASYNLSIDELKRS